MGIGLDMDKFISAVITMLIIGVAFRLYLSYVSKNRPKIKRPDWLKKKNKDCKD